MWCFKFLAKANLDGLPKNTNDYLIRLYLLINDMKLIYDTSKSFQQKHPQFFDSLIPSRMTSFDIKFPELNTEYFPTFF